MKISPTFNIIVSTLLSTFLLALSTSLYAGPMVVTHQSEESFEDVSSNIRDSIEGKGINVAHVLPAGEMLHRTGPTFDYKNDVYKQAQTFEFCSAAISHKLARQDPENIVLCPFTVSVYTLTSNPDVVNLSYRVPVGKPGSEAVVQEVVDLIESVIEESK